MNFKVFRQLSERPIMNFHEPLWQRAWTDSSTGMKLWRLCRKPVMTILLFSITHPCFQGTGVSREILHIRS